MAKQGSGRIYMAGNEKTIRSNAAGWVRLDSILKGFRMKTLALSVLAVLMPVTAQAQAVTSTGTSPARPHVARFANVLDFGAVCDFNGKMGTDNAAAFNAAAATGKPVYVPQCPLQYLVDDAINLQLKQVLFGDGRLSSVIAVRSTFNLSAKGVITSPHGEPGATIRDIGIHFYQPDTIVRANLIAYPAAFFMQNSSRFRMLDVRVTAGMTCIDARGNAGGAMMFQLELSCFDTALIADGALDTIYVDSAHIYPFGLTANQIAIYEDQANVGIDFGRVDACELNNIFAITSGKGIYLHESTNTPGTVSNCVISNYWDDSGRALVMSAGNTSVASMHSGLTKSWSQSIVHTGGNLAVAGLTIRDQTARRSPAIITNGDGKVSLLSISGLTAAMFNHDNTLFYADGGSTTNFALSGVSTFRYPNVTYTRPTVHVASGRGTIGGLSTLDKGTGEGTLLRVDTDDHIQLSNINAVGWAVTLPPALSARGPRQGLGNSASGALCDNPGTVGLKDSAGITHRVLVCDP